MPHEPDKWGDPAKRVCGPAGSYDQAICEYLKYHWPVMSDGFATCDECGAKFTFASLDELEDD